VDPAEAACSSRVRGGRQQTEQPISPAPGVRSGSRGPQQLCELESRPPKRVRAPARVRMRHFALRAIKNHAFRYSVSGPQERRMNRAPLPPLRICSGPSPLRRPGHHLAEISGVTRPEQEQVTSNPPLQQAHARGS